jgi:hypothetical protein
MAGVPGHWRTLTSDSDPDPEFLRIWTEEFDALSPWTVGRYGNEEDAERWGNEKVKQDFDFLKQRGDEGKKRVDYIPVVLPGGSVGLVMSVYDNRPTDYHVCSTGLQSLWRTMGTQ